MRQHNITHVDGNFDCGAVHADCIMTWTGNLTQGAVEGMYSSSVRGGVDVQVLSYKKNIPKNNVGERYRVIVSDGTRYCATVFAAQCNHHINEGALLEGSVCRIEEYSCQTASNRKLIVVNAITVLSDGPVPTIGSPQSVESKVPREAPPLEQPKNTPVVRKQSAMAPSTVPIAMLNPYNAHWTIKARVTNKGDMRTWNNARGSGKLFSVDLLDEDDGQIRATMFNDAADKFDPILQTDKVYYISKGTLKAANKQFSGHINNDYEITLNADAQVTLCEEDTHIKKIKVDLLPINELPSREKDSFIDVMGVVKSVGDVSSIVSSRTQKEVTKRVVSLVDESGSAVGLTLWGQRAESMTADRLAQNPVMLAKNVRVSDFGGCSLSTVAASQVEVNPDVPEAHRLRSWWDSKGNDQQFGTISGDVKSRATRNRSLLGLIKEHNLGFGEKPDYIDVKATITTLNYDADRPPWYSACSNDGCNKKVTEDMQGKYHCEKCNATRDTCNPRYVLSCQASDASGAEWISMFNEQAELLLGKTAAQLRDYKLNGDDSAIEALFNAARFKTLGMRLRVKAEQTPDGQPRIRNAAVSLQPINHAAESNALLQRIAEYGIAV